MAEPEVEALAESESFSLWRAREDDGEITYHLELGPVTFHFLSEDWEEFTALMKEVIGDASAR